MYDDFELKNKKLASMFEKNINNIHVKGIENIPNKGNNLFIVNHSCFLDIYLIPYILNMPCISMVSANSLFGMNEDRKQNLNKLLYPYPIEPRANKHYKYTIFKGATKLLENNNIVIFPQGVFDHDKKISKARTGAIRILFDALETKKEVYNIIPIALNVSNINEKNIQSSVVWDDFKASISILPPFYYNSYFKKYKRNNSFEDKKIILHDLMDTIMKRIADDLNFEYNDNYIPLYDMDGFWFPDGEFVSFLESENENLYNKYEKQIDSIVKKYCLKK